MGKGKAQAAGEKEIKIKKVITNVKYENIAEGSHVRNETHTFDQTYAPVKQVKKSTKYYYYVIIIIVIHLCTPINSTYYNTTTIRPHWVLWSYDMR